DTTPETTSGDSATADTAVADTVTSDALTSDTTMPDSSVLDTLLAEVSPTDSIMTDTIGRETGCGDTATYPAAEGCPDWAWASWAILPDSPGAANYGVTAICGDTVVIDKTTRLMWAQEEPDLLTWSAAKSRCAGSHRAGFSDWRLPTRVELESLVDYGK